MIDTHSQKLEGIVREGILGITLVDGFDSAFKQITSEMESSGSRRIIFTRCPCSIVQLVLELAPVSRTDDNFDGKIQYISRATGIQ